MLRDCREQISLTQTFGFRFVSQTDVDLCFIHGINDFGGKFAVHASKFLDEGVSSALLH
jgi:hypothetical protein